MRTSPNSFLNNGGHNTDTFTECLGSLNHWISHPCINNQTVFLEKAKNHPAIWTIKNSFKETIYSYVIAYNASTANKMIVLDELLRQAMLNKKLHYALTTLDKQNHNLFYQLVITHQDDMTTMPRSLVEWIEFARSQKFICADEYAAIYLLPDNTSLVTRDYFSQLNYLFQIYSESRLTTDDFQRLFLKPNSQGKRLLDLATDSGHTDIVQFIVEKGNYYLTKDDYEDMLFDKPIPESTSLKGMP